jgi:transposase
MKKLQRCYQLKIYANRDKLDTARYVNMRMIQHINMFMGKAIFNQVIYTTGMGKIANSAAYKANNIARAYKRSVKKLGCKMNIPHVKACGVPATIEPSENSKFDYWIRASNLWTRSQLVYLPAKSHKALNSAIRNGWMLSSYCEIKFINKNAYVQVFVSKETPKIKSTSKVIGCDVGIIHSVITSEGHKGHGLSNIMKIQKQRHGERRRQQHRISSKKKSYIKQILDREAKGIIRRSVNTFASIAVENPKRLAGLRSGTLHGWARSHFANRLHILGQEGGVKVIDISPYQTSITCFKCGTIDKRSRAGRIFKCVKCGHFDHADINAAKVIAMRGRDTLKSDGKKVCLKRFGSRAELRSALRVYLRGVK